MAMKGVYMFLDVTQKSFYIEMGQQLEEQILDCSAVALKRLV